MKVCSLLAEPRHTSAPLRILVYSIVILVFWGSSGWAEASLEGVEIRVIPAQGMAFCRFDARGRLRGGHASGGPAVRVYEAEGKVGPAVVQEIWRLAADLRRRGLVKGPVSWDDRSRGQQHLVLYLKDGSQLRLSWPEKQVPEDGVARQLAELLLRHHVGGW